MSSDVTKSTFDPNDSPQLFGHPTGLYTLFFAEMWERFSYYGMRALLLLYMIKGFLGFGDKDANAVYGAYTALVYMTPFFGGMIADRWLGARTAVVIGGLLMAGGHLLMMLSTELWFFTALGLLIAGNGFFKPNISTIVGSLYPDGSPKRDGGFTIFYIGINLGCCDGAIALWLYWRDLRLGKRIWPGNDWNASRFGRFCSSDAFVPNSNLACCSSECLRASLL